VGNTQSSIDTPTSPPCWFPGQQLDAQDVLFNNAPVVEITDVMMTLGDHMLRERYFDDPAQLKKELVKEE
jgi:hypothetical protein